MRGDEIKDSEPRSRMYMCKKSERGLVAATNRATTSANLESTVGAKTQQPSTTRFPPYKCRRTNLQGASQLAYTVDTARVAS